MRTLFHAALLATTLIGGAGLAGPVLAADLDHYYEPRSVPVYPPPPPRCGPYRPCLRPYARFGYARPVYGPGYAVPDYHHAYDPYGYEHDGYGRPRENVDRYGYDRPRGTYEHLGFGRLDRYGDEERRHDNEMYERPEAPRPDYREIDPYGRG